MDKIELTIITCKNNFLGQTRRPWTSIKTGRFVDILEEKGCNIEVSDFHEAINRDKILKNKTIFYSFSQKGYYRQYIKDIIFYLSKYNRVIPSYDLLMCHENKGYQQLYEKNIGINGLHMGYYTSLDEIDYSKLDFPFVLKKIEGTNGEEVYLIKNIADLRNIKKELVNKYTIADKIDLIRRKYLRNKKFKEYPDFSNKQDYFEYKDYIKQETNFILQKFIPNLSFDYRVLIAYDRYYVMRRDVNIGDFRASGTKKFGFNNEVNEPLLNYAKSIYEKFNAPFLSIDVVYNGGEYFLIEFQALHFGISVIMKSSGFFYFENNENWVFIKEKPDIEKIFANTISSYLKYC